jgi:ABC-type uncharacterized transport system ATPase subunit
MEGMPDSVPTDSHEPIIRFDHASFGFSGVIALKDISLSIDAGEFVGVIFTFSTVPATNYDVITVQKSAISRRKALWIGIFRSRCSRRS